MQHKKMQGVNLMVIIVPWVDYKKQQYFTNMKFNKQPYDAIQNIQGIEPMGLSSPWAD